jgi:uncharacterized protein
MKYLLVIAVVAIAFWLWRKGRQRLHAGKTETPPAAPPAVTPQAMARCAHCGLHLPAADALAGERGVYCSAAHRQLAVH